MVTEWDHGEMLRGMQVLLLAASSVAILTVMMKFQLSTILSFKYIDISFKYIDRSTCVEAHQMVLSNKSFYYMWKKKPQWVLKKCNYCEGCLKTWEERSPKGTEEGGEILQLHFRLNSRCTWRGIVLPPPTWIFFLWVKKLPSFASAIWHRYSITCNRENPTCNRNIACHSVLAKVNKIVYAKPNLKFNYFQWLGFPGCSVVKNPPANAGDLGSIPGIGRSPGEGNGNLLQYSCLGNTMAIGVWWSTIHGIAKKLGWLTK